MSHQSKEPLFRKLRRIRRYAQVYGPIDAKRSNTKEDLVFLVEKWRELKKPPSCGDMPDSIRKRLAEVYGGFPNAREIAKKLLTPSERVCLGWRCRNCGDEFDSAGGLRNHERACSE